MKLSLILLFLTVLLLCGVLLRAANNNKKMMMEQIKEKVTKVELQEDMEFVPNSILL